ncbi:MAG: hypothetical protein GQ540_02510 [Lutibacter sp.]|uniref:YbbR-like domain-containing protein n=1 Tax=Lutibacter sp. TaxID=1925666 RepID=UPI0019D83F13|nr:YbbR-like domain-containing protein [Lutibacter sp.]NOR27380.1 hypothetical protein [Lutibacter sp.]
MKTATQQTNLSINNKRKAKVFLFILLLTSIIWLLIELSKTYTSLAVFRVTYKDIPAGKLLQSQPVSEIKIALKAPGFTLLKYKVKKSKVVLSLKNTIKNGSSFYMLPNQQITYLKAQLSNETEVVNVLNDTIFIELGNNKSKKIPVNPSLDIKFKLGYNFIENIIIKPDSVLITGPEKFVDSIKELTTSVLKLSDVYESIHKDLPLKLPLQKEHLTFSATKIIVTGKVDKFTEGKFMLPITLINKPENMQINTFPKEIEVIYQAGLSNFNKITKNSFLIVYDFNQYKNDTLIKYLTPTIQQQSEFISTLKINPSQIEFLIQR